MIRVYRRHCFVIIIGSNKFPELAAFGIAGYHILHDISISVKAGINSSAMAVAGITILPDNGLYTANLDHIIYIGC